MGSDSRLARRLAHQFRLHWAGLAVIALAGAGYFYELGRSSLWYDEAYSAAFAALSWRNLVEAMVHADGQGMPYYAFLHLWTVFGDSETVLRIPSVLAALVAIGATYALGARLFGRWVGAVGAAFLGANPLFISLAREARSYSFAIAFATLSGLAFVAANASGPSRPRAWIAYVGASIAAAYGHLFGVFVVAAHVMYAVVMPRRVHLRAFAVALGAFVVAIIPVVWIALSGDPSHLDWIPRTTLAGITGTGVAIAGSPELAGIDSILLVVAVLAARHSIIEGDRFLWCWLLVPIASAIALSFVRPILVPRYLSIVLPAFCLLLARGLSAFQLAPAKLATAAIIVILGAGNPRSGEVPAEDWRGAVTGVLDDARAGDALIVFPPDRAVPVTYYLQRRAAPVPRLIYPAVTAFWRPQLPFGYLDFNDLSLRYPRLWLIVHMPEYEDNPELSDMILSVEHRVGTWYGRVKRERFRRVTVLLWSSRR